MSDRRTEDEQAAIRRGVPVRLLGRRALVIAGLTGLAVTQPVLSLLGDHPQFFVAGKYTTWQIVSFALVIALLPPLIGIMLTVVATLCHRRLGSVVFAGVVGALLIAFVLVVLRTLEVDGFAVAVLAVFVAAGLVHLLMRSQAAQLFVSYLAAANLAFVGLFLFVSPSATLVTGDQSAVEHAGVSMAQPDGPVVVVVLDELPAATIMSPDGTINSSRYPGFGELGRVSTWFRNASSPEHETLRAIPAILTGTRVDRDSLPTYADHPRNLFTMLGGRLPVHGFEPVTKMCPPTACAPPPPSPLRQALADATIVYGHRVLPDRLRDGLPPIDNSWGDFADVGGSDVASTAPTGNDLMFERMAEFEEGDRDPGPQAATMRRRIAGIAARPGLHYVHVLLPHAPWVVSRTGVASTHDSTISPLTGIDPDAAGQEFRTRLQYQLHSMQVGFVDTLIGELLDHLRSSPAWSATTLVVVADHGLNFTSPDLGREALTEHNREEVLRVPLFIKVPGQTSGSVRDDSAETIDIVPSLVDVLDIELDDDWRFDGHSLFDGSEPKLDPEVSTDIGEVRAIAARRGDEFPHGIGWLALAAVGDNGDLVGRDVADVSVGAPSELRARLDAEDLLGDLPTESGQMPFVLTGTLASDGGRGSPPELLVAVNGTAAGVVGGYRPRGDEWEFIGYVADLYRRGSNTVTLYEVERRGGRVELHEVT